LEQYADEIGVKPVEFAELVYLVDEDRYEQTNQVPKYAKIFSISGTQLRNNYLAKGEPLPEWFPRNGGNLQRCTHPYTNRASAYGSPVYLAPVNLPRRRL
jgi:ATP sulfurylase